MSLGMAVREAIAALDEQERFLFTLIAFCRTFSAVEQYETHWPYMWPFRPILVTRSEELFTELPVYRRQFEILDGISRADLSEGDSPRTIEFALAHVGYLLTLAQTNQLTPHWTVTAAGTSSQLMSCLYESGTEATSKEKQFQLQLLRDRALLGRYDEYTPDERRSLLVPDHGPVIDYDVELG